jgi:mono/diheme cytochrome c family protein
MQKKEKAMLRLKSIVIVLAGGFLCLAAVSWMARGEDTTNSNLVKRGEYLVNTSGCQDCHTPLKVGPNGPEPDMTHMLAGHPQELIMPPAPKMSPGPWMGSFSATETAWAGPWGVSFTRNLTPDKETGLGDWTEQNFVGGIRTGREMGKGRVILPPMPIASIQNMTDEDIKAMFSYLQTIPAVKNKVPEPVAPEAAPAGEK